MAIRNNSTFIFGVGWIYNLDATLMQQRLSNSTTPIRFQKQEKKNK